MLRRRFLMAVAAAVAGLAAPSVAKAGFTLTLDETGFGIQTITDDTSGGVPAFVGAPGTLYDSDTTARNIQLTGRPFNFAPTYGDFTISMTATASEGADQSNVFETTTSIKNNAATAKIIRITISNNDFSLPLPAEGDLQLNNRLTVNLLNGPNTLISGDPSSGAASLVGTATASPPTDSNMVSLLNVLTGTNSLSANNTTIWHRNGDPYTLTNLVELTLAPGATLNFTASTQVCPTPAPATLLLAVAGAPLFGLVGWLRRRSAVPAIA